MAVANSSRQAHYLIAVIALALLIWTAWANRDRQADLANTQPAGIARR